MRAVFVATLVALGIGLAVPSPTVAAPASGGAIANAAAFNSAVDQVHWRRYYRYHRHCWWRHGHRHCWW
jgi:hypothetical protein